MAKKVSIIIPCFNTERWISEAIDSCLQQTYPNIEIIVVDDGSTDKSLEIIKSYGKQVIWQSLPHQGGNHARNIGFGLSQGEYIQFLDADDYILPEKIERQVAFLEKTGADVVYGDWRYQRHLPDGSSYFDRIEIPGLQTDILAALLRNWWVAVAALFYRRSAVENSAGWDENLAVAQDRDFFLSVAINGAKVVYQPGCYAIYRRYGPVTVSTSSKSCWLKSHDQVMTKVEKQLSQMNMLSMNYRHALATSYFQLARESVFIEYEQYLQFLEKALVLFPEFKVSNKSAIYKFLQNILGFRQTERIASRLLFVKKLMGQGGSKNKNIKLKNDKNFNLYQYYWSRNQ
jgi:glycosyltransferase involved in cell wall biosynthesis